MLGLPPEIWKEISFLGSWKCVLNLRLTCVYFWEIFKNLEQYWKIWKKRLTVNQIFDYITFDRKTTIGRSLFFTCIWPQTQEWTQIQVFVNSNTVIGFQCSELSNSNNIACNDIDKNIQLLCQMSVFIPFSFGSVLEGYFKTRKKGTCNGEKKCRKCIKCLKEDKSNNLIDLFKYRSRFDIEHLGIKKIYNCCIKYDCLQLMNHKLFINPTKEQMFNLIRLELDHTSSKGAFINKLYHVLYLEYGL